MNRNLQSEIHPDADQLSVFVEGAATAREQERMLAHLAECAECRKAVFLMQPHEETQAVTATPAKGWMWRRLLLPVGLPAAALACGLMAVLIYIRPHGIAPRIPQQIGSVGQQEIERPGTTVAPTTKSERAPSTNSKQVARSGRRQSSFAKATATNLPRQENPIASGLNLPALKNEQATGNVAPQTTGAAPSASAPTSDTAPAQSATSSATISDLPLNGGNVANMQQPQPADTKGAASQNSLGKKKELPELEIQRASGQADTLAGVSGQITDQSGAIIAGATITLRDASGKTRQTTTGTDGSFRLTELPAGQYELIATANGFQTKKQPIELKPSELAMLQAVLDVGSASETVEVTAASTQIESAGVSGQVIEGMPSAGRVSAVPSGLPVTATISHGKLFLSLDNSGNVFLSRNGGKKWKKINPQWAGKAVRIELTPASMSEASSKRKNETSAEASAVATFQLTTDADAVWTSKDGKHWHQQ